MIPPLDFHPLAVAAVAWVAALFVWFAWVCYRAAKMEDDE